MRFAIPIIIVSLVLASAAFVAQPVQAQIPPVSDHAGQTCIDSPYGDDGCHEPLPNTTVRIQGGGVAGLGETDEETTSGDEGRFRFEDIPDGSYTVTVSRAGFETVSRDITLPDDSEALYQLPGKQVDVAGSVEDADGEPIPYAYVSMWGDGGYADAKSGADGAFVVTVVSGVYEVEVRGPEHGSIQQRMLIDGEPITLQLGALPGQDAVIKGLVTDQDGEPVADVHVSIRQWQAPGGDGQYRYGDFSNVTRTGADGRYEASVYSGGADIEFYKEGHADVYRWLEIEKGQTKSLDVELLRFPEKTARLQGAVVDGDGDPLRHISVRLEHPEYGINECSVNASQGGSYGHDRPAAEPYSVSPDGYYERHYPSCAITVHDDGTFTGNVTPGYTTLHVRYDRWAACDETHHADGSYERDCGPDYFSYTATLDLAAEADNPLQVDLRQKPGPDAAISGYVVDGEKEVAIPGARVSFTNQENYAYGSASTDDDGSFKIRLRSGYHDVSVWADGYLPWQGVVYVDKGGETPFDIVLTPGEARYGGHGGCCYSHAEVAYDDMGSADGMAMAEPSPPMESSGGTSEGSDYEDLGGGLGPYDPAARAEVLSDAGSSKGIPIPWTLALVGLLGAVLIRRR